MSHEFEYGWERFGDASFCVSTGHLSVLLDKHPDGFAYQIRQNGTGGIEEEDGIKNIRKLESNLRKAIKDLEGELDILRKYTKDIGQLEFMEDEWV